MLNNGRANTPRVHWCQVTSGDVIIDQRVGGRFITDPRRVKATMLSNGRVTAGVRSDLTWFVNRADVDIGVTGQRITRLRRWMQGCTSLLTSVHREAQVLVVETEDGDHAYRYELTLAEDGRVDIRALRLDGQRVTAERTVRLR